MERKKEFREKWDECLREWDGDVVKDLLENYFDWSIGKGGGGFGWEREFEEKFRDWGYWWEDDWRCDDGCRKDDKDWDRVYSWRDDGDKDYDWGDYSRRNDRECDMRYWVYM